MAFSVGNRLIAALDAPSRAEADALVDRRGGVPSWVKLGLELFCAEGPSIVRDYTRRGLSVYMTASPLDGFFSSVSATYVHATLDAPPPATPDNPTPAYIEGQALPFVPPFVVRADVSYERDLFKVRGEPLKLHAGYAATFLSPRPLPYSQEGQPVFLVDASLSVRRTFLEVGIDAANLLNTEYADTELFFVSHWPTRAVPSYLPARHIAAGPPLSILGHVTLHL